MLKTCTNLDSEYRLFSIYYHPIIGESNNDRFLMNEKVIPVEIMVVWQDTANVFTYNIVITLQPNLLRKEKHKDSTVCICECKNLHSYIAQLC